MEKSLSLSLLYMASLDRGKKLWAGRRRT